MPTSTYLSLNFVTEKFFKTLGNCRTFLDIGAGFGRWGVLAREMGDIIRGRFNPAFWGLITYAIEICPEYIEWYKLKDKYTFVYNADALSGIMELSDVFKKGRYFDFVIFGDVIEHFTKSNAIKLLEYCKKHIIKKHVILNIPLGKDWPQGGTAINSSEEHRSVWELEDVQKVFKGWKQDFVILQDFKKRPYLSFYGERQ